MRDCEELLHQTERKEGKRMRESVCERVRETVKERETERERENVREKESERETGVTL